MKDWHLAFTIFITCVIIFNSWRINRLIDTRTKDRYTSTDAKKDNAIMFDFIKTNCIK